MSGSSRPTFWSLVLLIAAAGIAARIAGAGGELWLDEIWSLSLAGNASSIAAVFTGIHHDNNHYLITLWMRIVGTEQTQWWYRLPSIVAGGLSVILAARIGQRRSDSSGLLAAGLISLSYLMIHYGSEARGYAIACCAALGAYDLLDAFIRKDGWWRALLAGLWLCAGLLSSLTIVMVWAGLALWALLAARGTGRWWIIAANAIPACVLASLWWVDLRQMKAGGGPEIGIADVLSETAGYMLGVPGDSDARWLALIGIAAVVAWAIWRLARVGDRTWLLHLVALLLAPAAVLIVSGRTYVYPRYFLVNGAFAYVLIAQAVDLQRLRQRKGVLVGATAAILLWIGANATLAWELYAVGRGHYRDAIKAMAQQSEGRPQVGSLMDFRSRLMVGYYQRILPEDKRPILIRAEGLATVGPQWLLLHGSPYEQPLPPELWVAPGVGYKAYAIYPSVRLSGLEAGVYQRIK